MDNIKTYKYSSSIGHIINGFVEQKRAAGYPYNSSSLILYKFDKMISQSFPNARSITKEICDSWLNINPEEHPNGLLRRVTPVRQLCKYMAGLGIETYIIPSHIPSKQIKYQPHIYTNQEIVAFFHEIDSLQKSPYAPFHYLIGPTIFRLIYCCGLRNSEARKLSVDDVNLETGKIVIRESKGWKSRTIYMSDTMTEQCRLYDKQIKKLLPDRAVFFPGKCGKCISFYSLEYMFHRAWDSTSESKLIMGNRPRIHDFRHSYVVNRVNQWVKEEADLNAMYPYLSEYLGHCHYYDTDYYLHLVDDFYPMLEEKMKTTNEHILPKLNDYEKQG